MASSTRSTRTTSTRRAQGTPASTGAPVQRQHQGQRGNRATTNQAATAATAAATTVAADQQPDVPSNSPGQVTATTSGPSVAQASTIPANATPLVGVIDPTLLQHDVGAMWAELQELRQHVRTFTPVVSMPTAGQGTAPVGHPHARFHSASPGSIPKPKGCAGGGKRGFHLQDEMGLGSEDGGRRYNMILSTVRELAHAARLDFSKPYRHASRGDLHNIFASARQIHPYLSVFENDWATAEILKQFMGNVRRYGKKCGYFS